MPRTRFDRRTFLIFAVVVCVVCTYIVYLVYTVVSMAHVVLPDQIVVPTESYCAIVYHLRLR